MDTRLFLNLKSQKDNQRVKNNQFVAWVGLNGSGPSKNGGANSVDPSGSVPIRNLNSGMLLDVSIMKLDKELSNVGLVSSTPIENNTPLLNPNPSSMLLSVSIPNPDKELSSVGLVSSIPIKNNTSILKPNPEPFMKHVVYTSVADMTMSGFDIGWPFGPIFEDEGDF
ncbi:hypothetical protein SUGI_1126380 [Cryptomeria japonica]|nr:hypothetical protein SUGI_1126380 [Cryptomeria japonica]